LSDEIEKITKVKMENEYRKIGKYNKMFGNVE